MANEIISNDYDIKIVDIGLLKPYENNPRIQNTDAIQKVKKSIEQNQFSSVVVVDKNYEIIAGHTRHAAAVELGMQELPVFIAKNLDENAVKRLRVLDNKLNELTEWDFTKLTTELNAINIDQDLADMFDLGKSNDLSEFDLSDDTYTPDLEEKFTSAIIQYVIVFDNDQQQNTFYEFLSALKEQYSEETDLDTHASRLEKHIKDWLDG